MEKQDYRQLCDPTNAAFRLAHSPFYLMAHADFKYHEDVETVLARYNVTKTMYRIMTVLRENEPSNIGFISEGALAKRSTVSRIVDRMVQMDLASTTSGEVDSRMTEVSLTQAGRDLLDTLTPVVGRQFLRAVAGVTNLELEQLIATLQKICGNLNKLAIE